MKKITKGKLYNTETAEYTSDLQQSGGSNIVKLKSKTVFFYSLQRNSRA